MRIKKVSVKERYTVSLDFEDGTSSIIDLGELVGKGVFKKWEDKGAFENVSIGTGGELIWQCGVDLCADALYLKATGKSVQELYPAVSIEGRCA